MSTINEKINENVNVDPLTDTETSTLQQMKAKKNKSNLFLIKSYSFIEKNNNNNNSKHNNNNNHSKAMAKISTASAPCSALLQSPDMEPFPDIGSLVLVQIPPDSAKPTKKMRVKKPKKPKQSKTRTKNSKATTQAEADTEEIDDHLLRRKGREYEELLEHLPTPQGTLPRPQSLPAKVHFETAVASINGHNLVAAPAKRSSGNIKRESFLRQSLQSIRRSFGSHKHSSKLSMSVQASPLPSPVSSNSSTASTSSTVSSSTSSSSHSATPLSLLAKAQTHSHLLDEFLPKSVVLLLNDDQFTEDMHEKDSISEEGYMSIRSASSVTTAANGAISGTDERATNSMAPLQLPATSAAAAPTNATSTAATTKLNEQQSQQQLQLRRQQYGQHHSLPETLSPEDSSLAQSSSPFPLQLSGSAQSLLTPTPSSSSRNSQSHSQTGSSSAAARGGNTAKQHDQQASAVAAISSTSAAAGAGLAANSGTAAAVSTPAEKDKEKDKDKDKDKEKEKKRKEVSSSRVKKFQRHFSQVSKDEKLINYFSCALVGDIPLQGHLYITEEHFAFYSNVFGYVTKVVIPTSSVTKISKEKTAKIIPNAVGVATADERHVFGSFISRESAFRLMCNVCTQLATGNEILPKVLPVDVELLEEYPIDDDSSCSISGNESPPQLRDALTAGAVNPEQQLLRQRNTNERRSEGKSSLNVTLGQINMRSSAPPVVHYEDQLLHAASAGAGNGSLSTFTSPTASSCGSPAITHVIGEDAAPASATAASSSPRSLSDRIGTQLSVRLPTLTELNVIYLGIMLAIMLALFSVFLLYRILDIEAKTNLYNTPIDFHLRSGNNEDIFAEALRWQKELQDKSTAEAQHILSKNLEQISKVRRSLETLSMLIHDRRSGYEQPESVMDVEPGLEPSQISSSIHNSNSD